MINGSSAVSGGRICLVPRMPIATSWFVKAGYCLPLGFLLLWFTGWLFVRHLPAD